MQHCSGDPKGVLESPSPSNEERNPQTHLLSAAEGATHTSSFPTIEILTRTSISNIFSPRVPDLSLNLATQRLNSQCDESYVTSRTTLNHIQLNDLENRSSVEQSHSIRPSSQVVAGPMSTGEGNRVPSKQEVEALGPDGKSKEPLATATASKPSECLCQCGGDAIHCLRPNRPSSPNTFFENFWAPKFAYILDSRLDEVRRNLEPSRRIWWREEFGGRAPDRKPLTPETWTRKYCDWGNVLRTSPPHIFHDNDVANYPRFWSTCNRLRSTSLLNNPDRPLDEYTKTPAQHHMYGRYDALKSLPIYDNGDSCSSRGANYWANIASHHSFSPTRTSLPKTRPSNSVGGYTPERLPCLKIPTDSMGCSTYATGELQTGKENEVLQQRWEAEKAKKSLYADMSFDGYRRSNGKSAFFSVKALPFCDA